MRELPPLMRMFEPTEEERAAMAPELEEMAERDAQIAAGALAQETAHLDIPAREAMSESPSVRHAVEQTLRDAPSPLESDRAGKTRFQEMLAGTDLWARMTLDISLSEQEGTVLAKDGLDPHKSLAAFASAYFEDPPTWPIDDCRATVGGAPLVFGKDADWAICAAGAPVSVNDPNIWSEDKVREYLGFAPYPADDGFWAFAEAFLEEVYPSDEVTADDIQYYFAEQFACGSVIPGVRALWDQWPTCNWREFADWLAGSAPGMGSSRRDFLMAGGDFMRVWREVSAIREEVHDMGVGFEE